MNKRLPTPKEHQLLIEVYQHINSYQEFSDNETLSEILHVESPRISYMKGELRAKGYLQGKHGQERLTSDAVNYLTNSESLIGYKIVLSTFIPMAGEVSAGRGNKYDDLAVLLNEQGETIDELSIPNLRHSSDKRIIALRVRGISMESAGILDGDYVIVELKNKNEFYGISEGQIIVTEYLSKEDGNLLEEEDITDLSDFDLSLVGYTLKVYHGDSLDRAGNKVYKLGRLRDYGKKNPHEIETRVIRPIGRVIGVYRDTSVK